MTLRALVRRAFPYVVIAGVGFGLAYVVVLLFVLPSQVVPSRSATVPDTPVTSGVKPIEPAPIATDSTPVSAPETSGVAPSATTAAPPSSPAVPVVIPDLSGMSLADARSVLEGMQVGVALQYDTSSLQPENTILRQAPVAGAQAVSGSTVTLILSRFPPLNAASTPHDSARRDSLTHDSRPLPNQSAPDTTHS